MDTSALDRAQLPGTITSSITTLGEAQRPTRLPISAKGVALSAMGLLLVAVGVGGIFVARRPPVPVRPSNLVTSAAAVPSAASPAAAPTATSASAAAPATGTERYPGGVGGASNVGPPDVAADVPLALERLPSGATLIVDGVTLPPGSHSVPRPRSGARAHLVVRAPGHKEQTIAFDESTPSPLTVKLAPAAPYDRGTNTGATPLPENPFGTKTSTTTTKEFKNPYQ